jgi:hypothetical protein
VLRLPLRVKGGGAQPSVRWIELLFEIQINKDNINPAGIQSKQ